jgi:hypothetical protein
MWGLKWRWPWLSSKTASLEFSFCRKMFCIIMTRHPSYLSVGKLVESTRGREKIKTQWKEIMGTGKSFHPSDSLHEQLMTPYNRKTKLPNGDSLGLGFVRKMSQYLHWSMNGKARRCCHKMTVRLIGPRFSFLASFGNNCSIIVSYTPSFISICRNGNVINTPTYVISIYGNFCERAGGRG